MRALLAVMAMLATAFAVPTTYAEQCSSQAGGTTLCSNSLCCNNCNWCALAELHLRHCLCASSSGCGGGGCQSHQCNSCCGSESKDGGVASVVSESLFDRMLLHRDDAACPARGFYTYAAFIAAASAFPAFGATGDADTRRREVAAFLAQTSYETTAAAGGRWAAAPPDGPYSWGYCIKEENDTDQAYCDATNAVYACAAGKKYYGRGPFQLEWNFNYGQAGRAIGEDLLGDPDLVATDPTVSFKTAIWYWMTQRAPVPSCHDVVTGRWRPSGDDRAAGREPGYGAVTNILNGNIECGHGADDRAADRIGFYQRYSDILGVSYGDNLYCYDQKPF